MFWKAGLKITPVYKESGGSPLSLTLSQAGWMSGRAGGLGPMAGQSPSLGPGPGKNGQVQSPEAASLPELTQRQGHRGCSCLKSFYSSKELNLQALSGERELSCDFGCDYTQARALAAGVRILTLGLSFHKNGTNSISYIVVSTKYSEEPS